ncbi:MAG: DUF4783 domain-containing protein [Flavobacteriales bacterium]|nr:DUF4783 domain-containing protein [Flavobacteriales bacterium]
MGLIYTLVTIVMLSVPFGSVESAFKSGNSKGLVSLSKEKILINVDGSEGVYSKAQATLVLKKFFTKYPAKSFKYIHKGKGSSEGAFAIGTYKSGSSEFRVTIHFKKINGSFKVESLAIEK